MERQLDIWSINQECEPNSEPNNTDNSKVIHLHEFRFKPDLNKVARLRNLADAMNKRIELCKQARSTHTAKKAREAQEFYLEAVELEVVQTWLYQMSQAVEANCLPAILSRIVQRRPLEMLRGYCKEKWYPQKLERWEKTTDEAVAELFRDPIMSDERDRLAKIGLHSATQVKAAISALWDLAQILEQKGIKPHTHKQTNLKEEAKLQSLQVKLASTKIRGFFPTQDERVHREIMHHAELEPGMLVLEPHGGQGDLIEAIYRECSSVRVETGEFNDLLFNILEVKGYEPRYRDFLETKGLENRYDRVIGNPPWGAEFKPAIELKHIRKMYECTKPEGRIVTLIPSCLERNQSAEYIEFLEWLDILEADILELPKRCFAQNKVSRTLTDAKLLVIEKPLIFPVDELVMRLCENFKGTPQEHYCTARKLFKLSRRLFKIAIVGFNERSLTLAEKDEIECLENQAVEIAHNLGTEVDVLSDIRGYILKLYLPRNQRCNCWAGKGWWGI